MGFGHRVYRAEDPRARVLRRTARELGAPRYEVAEALEKAALAELRERRPDRVLETNVEFWAAIVLDFAEVPAHMFTSMFTCARTGGWSAHILEQKRTGRLIRPSAIYTGPAERRAQRGGRLERRLGVSEPVTAASGRGAWASAWGEKGTTSITSARRRDCAGRKGPAAAPACGDGPLLRRCLGYDGACPCRSSVFGTGVRLRRTPRSYARRAAAQRLTTSAGGPPRSRARRTSAGRA